MKFAILADDNSRRHDLQQGMFYEDKPFQYMYNQKPMKACSSTFDIILSLL